MILSLTEVQVREAVAAYVNAEKMLTGIVVKPEHVTLKIGQNYDEAWFDGVVIDLAAARVSTEAAGKKGAK